MAAFTDVIFRKAGKSDIDAVFSMFRDAIAEMDRNGIPQWDELYPDRALLTDDIAKNELFVGTIGGEAACAYVINRECDEEYSSGAWKYPDASFLVIHRLCVSPKFQNRGLGSATVLQAEKEIKQAGAEAARLDVFTLNPYALKMYDRLGYIKVGTADWRKGRFWLMEKKL